MGHQVAVPFHAADFMVITTAWRKHVKKQTSRNKVPTMRREKQAYDHRQYLQSALKVTLLAIKQAFTVERCSSIRPTGMCSRQGVVLC